MLSLRGPAIHDAFFRRPIAGTLGLANTMQDGTMTDLVLKLRIHWHQVRILITLAPSSVVFQSRALLRHIRQGFPGGARTAARRKCLVSRDNCNSLNWMSSRGYVRMLALKSLRAQSEIAFLAILFRKYR